MLDLFIYLTVKKILIIIAKDCESSRQHLENFIVIVTLWQLCSVGGQYLQGGLLNSWTVIASSVEAAFQWNDNELQIMQMWIYVSYLLVMLPFAWLMDKKGLFLY